MITFSFRPRSESDLPWIAASVRTRVVSWKDAADSHDSVASDALVMPISCGRPAAGLPPSETTRRFSSSKLHPVEEVGRQQVRVARTHDRDPAQHLPHDDLDVLVVDRHALAAVHVLHLVHHGAPAPCGHQDAQHVCGSGVPTVSIWPTSNVLAVGDQQARPLRDGYSWTSEPSSGVTRILRLLSVSSISTRDRRPPRSGERPLGERAPEELDHAGADPA
jgi:hypothetical protein